MKPPVRKKKADIKCITFEEAFRINGNDILATWVKRENRTDTYASTHRNRVRYEDVKKL